MKKQTKNNKWLISFNPETREGYLHCPVCGAVYRYDILNKINKCAECNTVMSDSEHKEG